MDAGGILPSGYPRYNTGSLANNINFTNVSVIIGEYAGRDLYFGLNNYYNTYLGYRVGQSAVNSIDNILIGAETALNLYGGSNNIFIGREQSTKLYNSYDTTSVGYQNLLSDRSIFVGSYNESIGFQNILLGTTNVITNEKSIIIGNNNSATGVASNIIIIGNNIEVSAAENAIFIGNTLLHTDFDINIGDTVLKKAYTSNQLLYLGLGQTSVATGFSTSNILQAASEQTLYNTGGIFSDSITIGNYDTSNSISVPRKGSVTFVCNSNLDTDIKYILPMLPVNQQNVALSLNNNSELVWKKLSMTTDEIMQLPNSSNIYYDPILVDGRVESQFHQKFDTYFETSYEKRIGLLSTDRLIDGNVKRMIVNGTYAGDLSVSGKLFANHLIVNKIEVLGYGNNYEQLNVASSPEYSQLLALFTQTSNNLTNTINSLVSRIQELEKLQ